MKAVRFHEVGGPEVLKYEEIDQPIPGVGQVRLRVDASAFSAADNGMRAGFLPIPVVLPHIPGYDVSGTVDALGDGVDGFAVGDAVIAFLPMTTDGGAAEYVLAPADALAAAPTSPRSADAVRAAGADELIDHTETDVLEAVAEQVDLLLNLAPIEPDEFTAMVRLVRDGGVVVSTTAWMSAPGHADRGVRSVVVFVRSDAEKLAELVSLVDSGEITLEVTRRIPLAELPALHAEAAEGPIAGKVIVIP